MSDFTFAHIDRRPTSKRGAAAKIGFFKVEEESLIKKSNFRKRLCAHHYARTGKPIHHYSLGWDGQWHDCITQNTANGTKSHRPLKLAQC